MEKKKVKTGIIGVGHMGQYHVNVARQVADSTLTGVYDADHERAKTIASKYGANVYQDMDKLISDSDAVVVAVPTFLHYEIAKKALKGGKHVLVEKPVTETCDQARELVKIAAEKKLIFQVGHVERFNGAILELGKVVNEPWLIESRRLAPFNPRIKDVGVVLDMMIHDIDIVLNLVNSPVKKVSAVGSKFVSQHEDAASVVIQFENGCVANLNSSRCTQAKIRTLNITQKDAYIELDFASQEIDVHRQASSNIILGIGEIKYRQEVIVEKIFVHKDNPLKQEHDHFIDCIIGKTEPQVDGEKDIATLEVAQKILKEIHG